MITEKNASTVNGPFKVLRGLSTDSKPTDVANGSIMDVMDTAKRMMFDETNNQWREVGDITGGSGLPDVTSADNGKVLKVADGAWRAGSEGVFVAHYGDSEPTSTFSEVHDAIVAGKAVILSLWAMAGEQRQYAIPVRVTNVTIVFKTIDWSYSFGGLSGKEITLDEHDQWTSDLYTLVSAYGVPSDYNVPTYTGSDFQYKSIGNLIDGAPSSFKDAVDNQYTWQIETNAGGATFEQLLTYLVAQAKANGGAVSMAIPSAIADMWGGFVTILGQGTTLGLTRVHGANGWFDVKTVGISNQTTPSITAILPVGWDGTNTDEVTLFCTGSTAAVIVKSYTPVVVPFPS